jgi:putative spermidine/putrescine transport system substrate-binding protein
MPKRSEEERPKENDSSLEGFLKKKMTRRQAIGTVGKIAIGAVAVAAVGAAGYYVYSSGLGRQAETTSQTMAKNLVYWGNDIALGQQAIAEFQNETGISIQSTSIDFFTLAQRLIQSGGDGWDIGFTGRIRQIIAAQVIAPIPVSNLPRWKPEWLEPLLVHPESFLGPNYVKRFNQLLWKDVGNTLWAVPNIWNYDSVGYNPEFVPFEEQGGSKTTIHYSILWDPQYKGKTAMQDEAFTTFSETANYLNANNQLSVSDTVTNLNDNELQQVANYLKPVLQSGQIKTFWSDFGKIVTLFSTREIVAASCWQPVVYFTRAAGTPAYYARMVEGPFFWWNGDLLSVKAPPDKQSAAYSFFTFQMSPWWAANTAHNGYGIADPLAPDVKPFMGDEFWGWFYDGKPTYEPIDQIIKETWGKDHPEFENLPTRLQQALFRPDLYFPTGGTPRTGSPDPNGNYRDLGSIDDKNKITRYFLSPDFPDNPDSYQSVFSSLKAYIPS